jgi:hypothetical protein
MRQVLRQVSWIAMTIGLASVATGCGGDSDTTATSPTPVASAASPAIAASPSITGSPGQPGNPTFINPTVSSQNNAPRGILPPDLISSTDPNQRVRQVQSNRSDPFALLPTAPTVTLPPAPPTVAVAPPLRNPFPTSQASRNLTTGGSNGGGAGGSGALAPIPALVPRTTPIVPPPPQPDLARAVQVTGVVQVGETLYAIVNAPNEPTSRYVQAGQRLSNGKVLVRRIETTGAEPKVVLEQFGVEVVRAVGEGGAPASPTPAASVPTAINRG